MNRRCKGKEKRGGIKILNLKGLSTQINTQIHNVCEVQYYLSRYKDLCEIKKNVKVSWNFIIIMFYCAFMFPEFCFRI